jgi:hypothetical protein
VNDLERRLTTRLTFDSGDDYLPIWIRPGGREFLYNSGRPKAAGSIYRGVLDRPGEERLWLASERNQAPDSVTPDGRRVVFERSDEHARSSLWIRDLDGDSAPTRLTSATSNENSADVSPDGRWLAYASDATRSWEVYVRRIDGSGGAVRISNEGGFQPLWRRDGRELFYVDSNGRLVATPITLPASGSADLPRPGLPAPFSRRASRSRRTVSTMPPPTASSSCSTAASRTTPSRSWSSSTGPRCWRRRHHDRHPRGPLRDHRQARRGRHGRGLPRHRHQARSQVAIKVLPAAFTADAERLARFEREAKLLAQLHHPHIASIFGLEESATTAPW